jgi:hypothetical protein
MYLSSIAVLRKDEETCTLVWRAYVVGFGDDPAGDVAEVGEVVEHLVESESEVPSDVLADEQLRSERADGVGDVGP